MNKHVQVSKNKSIELELAHCGKEWEWLQLHIEITRHRDHAGVAFYVEVLGFELDVRFYDHRHWDYDKNDWCKHEYKGTDSGTLGQED